MNLIRPNQPSPCLRFLQERFRSRQVKIGAWPLPFCMNYVRHDGADASKHVDSARKSGDLRNRRAARRQKTVVPPRLIVSIAKFSNMSNIQLEDCGPPHSGFRPRWGMTVGRFRTFALRITRLAALCQGWVDRSPIPRSPMSASRWCRLRSGPSRFGQYPPFRIAPIPITVRP